MDALIIIGYIALAALIVFLSIKLSDYVDMLDKSTNLSGALLGGILLAAVTSLPELFTSLTAVLGVGKTDYVLGNILGSNIFDIIVLAVLTIIFVKNFKENKLSKSQVTQFIILIALYGVTSLAIFLPQDIKQYIVLGGWFNIFSIAILGLYVLSLFLVDKTKSGDEEEEKVEVKLSVKQLVIRFSIAAVILISASIGVTYLSDMIVERFSIDATLAGALLLGVMTSLPEVISTFNLFFRKNVNAGTGNIVGSAVFNYLIIFLSELFSFKGSVLAKTSEASKLLIFNITAAIFMLIVIIVKMHFSKKEDTPKNKAISYSIMISFAVLSFASYILYLFLPNSMFAF